MCILVLFTAVVFLWWVSWLVFWVLVLDCLVVGWLSVVCLSCFVVSVGVLVFSLLVLVTAAMLVVGVWLRCGWCVLTCLVGLTFVC